MSLLTQFAQTMDGGSPNSLSGPESTMVYVIVGIVFLIIFAVIYAVNAWLLGRIFAKAGVAKSIAWIPGYNIWKLLELGGQNGALSLLVIIPIFTSLLIFVPALQSSMLIINLVSNVVSLVGYVFVYIAMYKIGLKLQKEGWFVILAIFVPLAWLIWLAFDKSTWYGVTAEGTPAAPAYQPAQSNTTTPPDSTTTPEDRPTQPPTPPTV